MSSALIASLVGRRNSCANCDRLLDAATDYMCRDCSIQFYNNNNGFDDPNYNEYYDEDDDFSDSSFTYFTTTTNNNSDVSASAVNSFLTSLPVVNNPNSNCSICMEDFNDGARVVVQLPCKHCFDRDCIGEWIKRSSTCPICRFKFDFDRSYYDNYLYDSYQPVFSTEISSSDIENALGSMNDEGDDMFDFGEMLDLIRGWEPSSFATAMHDEDGDTLMLDVA